MTNWRKIYNINSSKKLLNFKNKHVGESCIIMGSSPILKNIPLDFIKKFKVFGVNATANYCPPDYLVSIDLRCSWFPNIRRLALTNGIPYFIKFHVPPQDINLFKKEDLRYFKNEVHLPVAVITSDKDIEKDIIDNINDPTLLEHPTGGHMGVIQNLALPLAFYMGFCKVYFVGVEFPYVFTDSNQRFYNEPTFQNTEDEYNKRRWSLELISKTNKKERVFTLNKECSLKNIPFVDYKHL